MLGLVDLGVDGVAVTGDMRGLQRVRLGVVFMSAVNWDIFINSLLALQQVLEVVLRGRNIDDALVSRASRILS